MGINMVDRSGPVEVQATLGQWIIVLLCVAFCFVELMTESINKYASHALWIAWMISLILFDGIRLFEILSKKRYLWLYAFASFYFLSSTPAVGLSVSLNRTVALFEMVSPIIMYDYFCKSNKKIKITLVMMLLAITIFNVIPLITAINTHGLGLRLVHQEEDEYMRNAYNWAYSWVLIATAASRVLFNKKDFPNRNIFVIVFVSTIFAVGCFVVVSSMFMTAVVSLCVGIILSLTYGRKRWFLRTFAYSGLAIFLFVYFFPFVLRQTEIFFDGSGFMSQRVEEIYMVLHGNEESASDYNSRKNLSMISINTFLNSPIWGINHEIDNFEKVQYIRIGDHSEWIDNLALYGLFSFLLLFFLVKTSKESIPHTKFVTIVYLFIGFFNPIWYFLPNFSVFFFIPLALLSLRII